MASCWLITTATCWSRSESCRGSDLSTAKASRPVLQSVMWVGKGGGGLCSSVKCFPILRKPSPETHPQKQLAPIESGLVGFRAYRALVLVSHGFRLTQFLRQTLAFRRTRLREPGDEYIER